MVLDGYNIYQPITITGVSSTLTNYVITIRVDYKAGMNTNYSDIRFTSADDNTILKHYLVDYKDSYAIFDVQIPSIPANQDLTIHLWAGKSENTDASDVSIYQFYESGKSLDNWTVVGGNWNVINSDYLSCIGNSSNHMIKKAFNDSGNKHYRFRIKNKSLGSGGLNWGGLVFKTPNNETASPVGYNLQLFSGESDHKIRLMKYNGSTYTTLQDSSYYFIRNLFFDLDIIIYNNRIIVKIDGVTYIDVTDSEFTSGEVIRLLESSINGIEWDYKRIRVTEGVYPEPAITMGSWQDLPISNFKKYKLIAITGSSAGAVSNYVLPITVPYETGKMKSNFGDIRFASADGLTEYPATLVYLNEGVSAIFDVKIPSIPQNSSFNIRMYSGVNNAIMVDDTTIYQLYEKGNSLSNWTAVVGGWISNGEYLCPYNVSTYESIKTAFADSGGHKYSFKLRSNLQSGRYPVASFIFKSPNTEYPNLDKGYAINIYTDGTDGGGIITIVRLDGGGSINEFWGDYFTISNEIDHKFDVSYYDGVIKLKMNGTLLATTNQDNNYQIGEVIRLRNGNNNLPCYHVFKELKVSEYISPEPSFSIGSEWFVDYSEFSGEINATSTLTGHLDRLIKTSGTITASSTLTATINKYNSFSGSINSISGLSATLNIIKDIIGNITSTSTLTATINKYNSFSGSINSASNISATIQKIMDITGNITSISTLRARIYKKLNKLNINFELMNKEN